MTNIDVEVYDGQMVSVAWVIRNEKQNGPYLIVVNK